MTLCAYGRRRWLLAGCAAARAIVCGGQPHALRLRARARAGASAYPHGAAAAGLDGTRPQPPLRPGSYVMVKPDGVQRGLVGEIIGRFERKGFKLRALKLYQTPKDVSPFVEKRWVWERSEGGPRGQGEATGRNRRRRLGGMGVRPTGRVLASGGC
jgi:hypothetical protein